MMKHVSVVTLLASGLVVTGCATKKYVRNTVDPVNTRVGQVETRTTTVENRTTTNEKNIEQVGTSASRANERAATAERLANEAGQSAAKANDAAQQAGQRADQARGAAEQASNRVGVVERSIENIDNYKQVSTTNVLFRFNRADLTPEGKQQLDQIAQQVGGMKRFVIEVTGFTDRSGGANYNLALSERRANAVIRYLTAQRQIPLRSVRYLGQGVDPVKPENGQRVSRKENRRVEVRIFAPDVTGAGSATDPSAPRTTPTGTTGSDND